MKNVLVIAYYFPPSGGPGVQRVLKHIKYLKEFGWNPIVLTVSNGQFPARDESLMKEIPKDIKVYRSHIFEPYDLYRKFTGKSKDTAIDVNVIKKDGQKSNFKENIAEFIRATFFIPDARIGWINSAVKIAEKIMEEYKIDAIYSSSPPYTCSMIARKLKRKYKIKWVAGFRDPWTGFISSPKRWFLPKAIDKSFEKSVFKEADSVECAWIGIIKDAFKKYPELAREPYKSKFHHVPNGFDSSDFPDVKHKRNDKFILTYTGSMYGRRNPSALFEAIENLISNNLIDSDKFEIKLVGRFGNEIYKMIENTSFKETVNLISYIPHKESIKHLMLSDALLLIVDESKESEEIVPGKVYEYIGIKKPLIAIAPKNSAIADLIKKTNAGKIAHQSEIKEIEAIFLEYFNNWKNENDSFNPNHELIANYERRNSTKYLAKLLD